MIYSGGLISTRNNGWHELKLSREQFVKVPQIVGSCARVKHLVRSHMQPSPDSSGRRPYARSVDR